MTNKVTKCRTIYIDEYTDIPIIGANSFGLVDRDTNVIELKPITGCNLSCTFCSVDEGPTTKKKVDFVVGKDYLVDEFKKLVKYKESTPIYAYINVHGEPLMYEPIIELIRDLKQIEGVICGIITNGTLLSEKMIDSFAKVGLDRINISLNAFSKEKSKELAGNSGYNVDRLCDMIKYANNKIEVVVAPIYLHGINDTEMEDIIRFIAQLQKENSDGFPILGIQNFLRYKLGRNPCREYPWEKFNALMKEWEDKYNIDLSGKDDKFYNIFATKKLMKPLKKNDVLKAKVVLPDRFDGQCFARANGRLISIIECRAKPGASVKIRIIRDKDNIFVGTPV